MAGVMTSSMFPNSSLIVTKNLKIYTKAAYMLWPDEYKGIVNMQGTDLKIEKQMRYEGGGAATEKTEGETSNQKRIYEGYIQTGVQKVYSVEMPVTWEQRKYVVKNAQFMNQLGQYNARSSKLTKEYDSANVLNNGFSGGGAGGDGEQYFSASHLWKSDATTYDNLLDSVDFGRDAIEDAFVEMAQATVESNIPAQLIPRKINFAYSNLFNVPELLKTIKDPESANNTHNVVTDYNLKMNLNHFLTDGGSYYIDTDVNTRTMFTSQKTTFDSYYDNPTMNLIERALQAHVVMFHDQLGTYGSQGG